MFGRKQHRAGCVHLRLLATFSDVWRKCAHLGPVGRLAVEGLKYGVRQFFPISYSILTFSLMLKHEMMRVERVLAVQQCQER